MRRPPRRTTVLAFITAHIHAAPFSTTKRSTTRWLADNPGEPAPLRRLIAEGRDGISRALRARAKDVAAGR